MESTIFISENVAPEKAHHIGVYDEDGNKVGNIALGSLKTTYGTKLYSFGLMSDVHYYDADYTNGIQDNDGSQFNPDTINAMKFFNDYGCEFVCIPGDMTLNDMGHAETYYHMTSSYTQTMPAFCCTGNHDTASIYLNGFDTGIKNWKKYTFPNTSYEIHHYNNDSDDTRNFYFIKDNDVFIFLSVDYKYEESYPENYLYYDNDVLNWFSNTLEEYKDKRVFVFTHLFFRQKAGNYKFVYSNADEFRKIYCLTDDPNSEGEQQFTFLNDLNNKYKNSIWFTGHSHFYWEYQDEYPYANICKYDNHKLDDVPDEFNVGDECAYNVHVPSSSRPLNRWNGYDLNNSEIGVVDVYSDCIVIKGIDAKDSERVPDTENTMSIDDYFTDDDQYLNADNFTYNTSRNYPSGATVENIENGVIITFTSFQGFYVNVNNDENLSTPLVKIDEYKAEFIKENSGGSVDITESAICGFKDSNSTYPHTTTSAITYDTNGLSFIYSSQSTAVTPINEYKIIEGGVVKVTLKAKVKYIDLEEGGKVLHYINKFIPIAYYKLPVSQQQ